MPAFRFFDPWIALDLAADQPPTPAKGANPAKATPGSADGNLAALAPLAAQPSRSQITLLQSINRHADAEPLYRRALEINEKSLGPDHPNVALNNLAQLLQEANRHAEAEPLMRRAVAIGEKSFGPDHPDVAHGLHNLAQFAA